MTCHVPEQNRDPRAFYIALTRADPVFFDAVDAMRRRVQAAFKCFPRFDSTVLPIPRLVAMEGNAAGPHTTDPNFIAAMAEAAKDKEAKAAAASRDRLVSLEARVAQTTAGTATREAVRGFVARMEDPAAWTPEQRYRLWSYFEASEPADATVLSMLYLELRAHRPPAERVCTGLALEAMVFERLARRLRHYQQSGDVGDDNAGKTARDVLLGAVSLVAALSACTSFGMLSTSGIATAIAAYTTQAGIPCRLYVWNRAAVPATRVSLMEWGKGAHSKLGKDLLSTLVGLRFASRRFELVRCRPAVKGVAIEKAVRLATAIGPTPGRKPSSACDEADKELLLRLDSIDQAKLPFAYGRPWISELPSAKLDAKARAELLEAVMAKSPTDVEQFLLPVGRVPESISAAGDDLVALQTALAALVAVRYRDIQELVATMFGVTANDSEAALDSAMTLDVARMDGALPGDDPAAGAGAVTVSLEERLRTIAAGPASAAELSRALDRKVTAEGALMLHKIVVWIVTNCEFGPDYMLAVSAVVAGVHGSATSDKSTQTTIGRACKTLGIPSAPLVKSQSRPLVGLRLKCPQSL
jgi:hypothetical protein